MPENAINPAVRQIHERVFLVATRMNDRESNHRLLLRHDDKSNSIQTKENFRLVSPQTYNSMSNQVQNLDLCVEFTRIYNAFFYLLQCIILFNLTITILIR